MFHSVYIRPHECADKTVIVKRMKITMILATAHTSHKGIPNWDETAREGKGRYNWERMWKR